MVKKVYVLKYATQVHLTFLFFSFLYLSLLVKIAVIALHNSKNEYSWFYVSFGMSISIYLLVDNWCTMKTFPFRIRIISLKSLQYYRKKKIYSIN